VPKGTLSGGRSSAFGHINRPKVVLRGEINKVFQDLKCETHRAVKSATGYLPVKRLRNSLISAMQLSTATQPVATVVRHKEPNTLRRGKHAKQTVVWNPIWDIAPQGAFYKAKRVCSLITDVVMLGSHANISRDVERLAIKIWQMSKRHFDGLVRSIRAKIARSTGVGLFQKNPEALKRFEALIRNPYLRVRGKRFSRNRRCKHNACFDAMRLSTDVGLARESLRCTKCRVPGDR